MAQTAAPHTLVLPIAPERWPPPQATVEVDGLRLDPKPELHATLVGTALGAELHATFGNRASALVRTLRDTHDWRFERGRPRLLPRKARSGERRGGKECVRPCKSRGCADQ